MASPLTIIVTLLAIVTPSLASIPVNTSAIVEKLVVDYYKTSCPNAEQIVRDVLSQGVKKNPGCIPGIIRLHFHDCFITGCDGSILLTPEKYNSYNSEMGHPANSISLRGMDCIDEIKAELEKQCPNIVSCADILAFAARDAIVMSGSPQYKIPAGRRDGTLVDGNLAGGLPKGSQPIPVLAELYAAKGLTVEDLVVLEGSHSIGRTRCLGSIADTGALMNATGAEQALDKTFATMVGQKFCPAAAKAVFFNMTGPLNPEKLDTAWGVSFYDNIQKGKSLIPADLAMSRHPMTQELVQQLGRDSALWMNKFNEAMIKLGKMNVITGEQGEIRRQCNLINAVNLPAQ